MEAYHEDKLTALQAMEEAQWLAFAPVAFQAARALRNLGILAYVEKSRRDGATLQDIEKNTGLSRYGVRVLCEAGLATGLLISRDGKYMITKKGSFFLHDNLTIANSDFINDVCYQGLMDLEKSIVTGKPEGLKHFGKWNTVYEALSSLPGKVKDSWLKFDHYYSDQSFREALPHLFSHHPLNILDIGGNTGKFALQCVKYSADVIISILDLPGQLEMAKRNILPETGADRIRLLEGNILDADLILPQQFDIIWMSQFLDCFSEEQVVSILKKCKDAMKENTRICILEPFWDRQRFGASAFSLQMTSLYFTAIANGNSQMYHSDTFSELINASGLEVERTIDGIGLCHSLLICK